MADPLINRSAEALAAALEEHTAHAEEQIRLLTMSEIAQLRAAALQLADIAARYVHNTCAECKAWIVWRADDPTGQSHGWRHVDQPAYYRLRREHRARPEVADG